MDALVHLRKKRGAGERGEANARESVLATLLWGMIYADDAGVVSQSPATEQLRKMMGVIVVVCAAFSLTVSEANCYKWWPYILALYLQPTYCIIHTIHIFL